jgi:hypothetical protein
MARAQQPTLPMAGLLTSLKRNDRPNFVKAMRLGLSEVGYVEGVYQPKKASSDKGAACAYNF